MASYRKPCKYCNQLIPPNSSTCPVCGRINPLKTMCPRCRAPVEPHWVNCNSCGLALAINCPKCGQSTFFGDYCLSCGERLVVECKKCRTMQPPVGTKCIKCGKPL